MADHAELIFTGGRVHTVNAENDVVPAIAVGGGRVLTVGSDDDVRALAGPGTRVVELKGRSLLPGFIDAHAHLAGLGMAEIAIDCKAPGMQSIAALRMHTINGACASFEERDKGSLERGKLADLVILGEDLARAPAREIRQIPVAMTAVGGRVVYESA